MPAPKTIDLQSNVAVEVVSDIAGFDALQPDWDRLVDAMEVPSPFLTWAWNNAWWRVFGRRRQLRVLVVRESGEVIGIVPLYRRGFGPVRALVPLGWPDRLSEQMEPIAPAATRPRVVWALSEVLSRQRAFGLVPGVDRSSAVLFGEQAIRNEVYSEFRLLPPSWDELTNGLHRSMRGNIRYYPRLLERSGHRLVFRVEDSAEGVGRALPTLFALHTARSKAPTGERHIDRLAVPARRDFLNRLAAELPQRGQMKVGLLQVDGVDVAAQLWFERGKTAFLHYSGYEPEWARFSVAMIVTAEIMRLCVERGLTRVEFLRGSKQFKTRWNTEQRGQFDVYYVWSPWLLPVLHRVRSLRRKLRSRAYKRSVTPLSPDPAAD